MSAQVLAELPVPTAPCWSHLKSLRMGGMTRTMAACRRCLYAPGSFPVSLPAGKTASRDSLVQASRSKGLSHTNKPLESVGQWRPRGAFTALQVHNDFYLQPLLKRTRWEANQLGSSIQMETELPPLLHDLQAATTFLIPRDLPLLALRLFHHCTPQQCADPPKALSWV